MTIRVFKPHVASSLLRVSAVCFQWNGDGIDTIIADDRQLPSIVPEDCESLDQAAMRVVMMMFLKPAAYMEQLYTFDTVIGEDRETHVTYLALFPPNATGDCTWTPIVEIPPLSEQVSEILEYAITRLRAKLEYTNIAFHLMPEAFTLAALQEVYESILAIDLDKRNFRRRMIASGMLEATGEKLREGPHRPAELYRFSGHTDHASYLTPRQIAEKDWQESPT